MNFGSDLRFAFRQLRKSPGVTATVLVTLGLCIGANTAIYSIVDATLVKSLPYPQADRLGSFARHLRAPQGEDLAFNMDGLMWQAVDGHATRMSVAVESGVSGVNLVAQNQVEYVQQQRVSAGYFHVLGIKPIVGRELNKEEDTKGGPAAAVLSYQLWQRIFHGDTAIVGRLIELRGEPFTVVGVLPQNFVGTGKADLWTPLRPSTTGEGGGTNYRIVARLKPGVLWSEAAAETSRLEQPVLRDRLQRGHAPSTAVADMQLISLQKMLTDAVRSSVLPKWGATLLILCIGCANIAGILLALSAVRQREMATRLALGASRGRVITQLLTESLLLALGGGALGLVTASLALKGLQRLGMDGFDLWHPVTLDGRVLLVTVSISVLTGILFGIAPALETSRLDIRSVLLEGGRGMLGRKQQRIRQALVVGEVALGIVLLVSAGLLIRTLAHLAGLAPGFDPRHVLVAQLSLQDARYTKSSQIHTLLEKSLERIRSLPGVESAAVGLSLPYEQPLNGGVRLVEDSRLNVGYAVTDMILVTPDYFKVLRMPVQAGRALEERDQASGRSVAVVNAAFLKKYGRNSRPLGLHLDFGEGTPAEVVGVVADTPQRSGAGDFGPLSATPTVYLPFAQMGNKEVTMLFTWFSPRWIVRTHGAEGSLRHEMQAAVRTLDPKLPFSAFQSMATLQGSATGQQRYQAVLFSMLAGLALLLAGIGVYGLVSAAMTQRTREFGIRLALGATVRHVAVSLLRPGLLIAAMGMAIGVTLSWFVGALLHSLIWGVPYHDIWTYLGVMLLLGAVVIVTHLLLLLRLRKLDPAQVLHDE